MAKSDKPCEGELKYYVGDEPPRDFKTNDRKWMVVCIGRQQMTQTPIDIWQRYASPVWMDINQTRTLQYMNARDNNDERHISPLQLDVIERAMQLWSTDGDVVFKRFTGIGSGVM